MLSKLIVFKLGRMEPPHLMLEEEYNKDHHARYIEAAQVTKIVKKNYINNGSRSVQD
jgi:hypothetical protein